MKKNKGWPFELLDIIAPEIIGGGAGPGDPD